MSLEERFQSKMASKLPYNERMDKTLPPDVRFRPWLWSFSVSAAIADMEFRPPLPVPPLALTCLPADAIRMSKLNVVDSDQIRLRQKTKGLTEKDTEPGGGRGRERERGGEKEGEGEREKERKKDRNEISRPTTTQLYFIL